jgi:hypothetical protein
MERTSASNIINAVLRLSERLNDVDELPQRLPEEDERKALLKTLGATMLELDVGLIRPLVRQHPDLDPDR